MGDPMKIQARNLDLSTIYNNLRKEGQDRVKIEKVQDLDQVRDIEMDRRPD